MTHPIPVRRLLFESMPAEEFKPDCVAANPVLSYTCWGVSMYVTFLEPFIVKSMHRIMDDIKDDDLRENVDRFARQEAQHYQQHQRFNEALFAQGYPGLNERYEILRQDFDRMLEEESDKYCVGFVEGFESYTTQGAIAVFKTGIMNHPETDPRVADLFNWHLMEEIEHRTVAFDIYDHLYGDYLYRVKMCLIAQGHITRFIMDCTRIMSAYNVERFGKKYQISLPVRMFNQIGRVILTTRSCLPWYTPHRYVVPEGVESVSKHYSDIAQSVS